MRVLDCNGTRGSLRKITISLLFSLFIVPLPNQTQEPKTHSQPMVATVEWDAGLADPFFQTDKAIYPWWIVENEDGTLENTQGGPTDKGSVRRLPQTASCWTEFQLPHEIHFCEARLLKDNRLEIYLHDESASTYDNLKMTVKDGRFSSQYWTNYPVLSGNQDLVWITKNQRLILDRKNYRAGDVLKGRVAFTCAEKRTKNPNAGTQEIKIEGVFKTKIVQADFGSQL